MRSTRQDLMTMASHVHEYGLHTGEQCATDDMGRVRLDILATAYCVAEWCAPPAVFFTDQAASLALIEASTPAMTILRALSASINDYEVPDTDGQPDVVEHVYNWTATPGIGQSAPPSTAEVIGRLLRAAENAHISAAPAA